ncbi:MAG: hypothetical protein K0R07_1871 [Sedimentibacter sp.]|jgi:hypothetical protein|nr:hypothetical protein [Sedimentibacter sp.]
MGFLHDRVGGESGTNLLFFFLLLVILFGWCEKDC